MNRFYGLAVALALLPACKPGADHSRTESLDNFAGGEFTLNACSGHEPVLAPAGSIQAPKQYESEIAQALTAVPASLQQAFFEVVDGKIILTRDIAAACGAKGLAESATGLVSCWNNPTPTSVAIYIKEDATPEKTVTNIRHATVRAFGYMVSQFLLRLGNGPTGTVLVSNAALDQVQSELALATLLNVAASDKYDLKAFKGLVPDSVLDKSAGPQGMQAAWGAIANTSAAKRFGEFVFAETFDSYYCSATSRAKLAADFARKGAAVHAMFGEFGAEMVKAFASDASVDPAETSYGLWGRWGPGNGPVRQAFRNWGAWRANGNGLFNFRRAAQGGGFVINRWRWFGGG